MAQSQFLSDDGYINVEKFKELAKEIEKVAKAAALDLSSIQHSVKAIPKYDKERATERGEQYVRQRAQPIKSRTRMPQSGARVKMVVYLPIYKGLTSDFDADIAAALKAIEKHNIKAEKFITNYKEKAKVKREKLAKEFDVNLDVMIKVLTKAGIEEKNIATGKSMMGKTLLVRLPNGGFISVGKADAEKFSAAKNADAPAKVGGKVGKTSGKPIDKVAKAGRVSAGRR